MQSNIFFSYCKYFEIIHGEYQLLKIKYTAPSMHKPAHIKSVLNGCFKYIIENGMNTDRVITSCMIFS